MPPYLAGRDTEQQRIRHLLNQRPVMENVVLTGLRGVGKTVLLETFKPIAQQQRWLWVGTDLSESTSVSEERLATRLLTDVSVITSSLVIDQTEQLQFGFARPDEVIQTRLNYAALTNYFGKVPGLISDKLKATLEMVWRRLQHKAINGIVFAYDEAQNLSDYSDKEQYPLSLLLDIFQSLQRKGIPYMLILTGLPTLFAKLVEARTYSERMFHIMFLRQLGEIDSRDAIVKPVEDAKCPIQFSDDTVESVIKLSGGYPYFIQFVCREVYEVWIQQIVEGESASVPVDEIERKLDNDFFAGRWARATDRQRDLLRVIALLPTCDTEFTLQEAVEKSNETLDKPFTSSHVNQMLVSLSAAGLVYKNRYGKYSFAVPLLSRFIRRQME